MRRPRSRLLTGEQRPSNLICVTHLRSARQINSGRLGEQGGGVRVSLAAVQVQGKESATIQQQSCSKSAQMEVLHRNDAQRQQFVSSLCDFK